MNLTDHALAPCSRNHSGVSQASKRLEAEMEGDGELRGIVENLRQELNL